MINLPKNLIKAVIDGGETSAALEAYIMHNYSMGEIISSLTELLISNETYNQQIVVTQEEYNAIISLFKIKGQRMMEDGTVISETRGRKRKGE